MNKRRHLFAVLPVVCLFIGLATMQTLSEGILIESYFVDTLFVLDMVSRMASGEVPHVDFTLHLGALPFSLINALSSNVLDGFFRAQYVLSLLLMCIAFWVGVTRLKPILTSFLALIILITTTSLAPSFDHQITPALFYNRWAWAIATLFLVLVLVEPRKGTSSLLDGVVCALLVMALLMIKITFFVALAPVGVLALILQKRMQAIFITFVASVVIVVVIAAFWGPSFWWHYFANLVWVADNPVRVAPGRTLWNMVLAPEFLALSVTYLAFVGLVFATAGPAKAGLFAIAGVCLCYVQYQNFAQVPV